MKNIFENAYFGKQYKTRNEWKAIYIDCEENDFNSYHHRLLIEDTKMFVFYNDFGTAMSFSDEDIVSKWQEEISEEELDKLAEVYVRDSKPLVNGDGVSCFKAGYRKAKGL